MEISRTFGRTLLYGEGLVCATDAAGKGAQADPQDRCNENCATHPPSFFVIFTGQRSRAADPFPEQTKEA